MLTSLKFRRGRSSRPSSFGLPLGNFSRPWDSGTLFSRLSRPKPRRQSLTQWMKVVLPLRTGRAMAWDCHFWATILLKIDRDSIERMASLFDSKTRRVLRAIAVRLGSRKASTQPAWARHVPWLLPLLLLSTYQKQSNTRYHLDPSRMATESPTHGVYQIYTICSQWKPGNAAEETYSHEGNIFRPRLCEGHPRVGYIALRSPGMQPFR